MATCPRCGRSSCTTPDLMTLMRYLVIEPPAKHSIAGVRLKFAAERVVYKLACRCGWTVTGQIEGGHLVPLAPNPTTEEKS